MEKIQPLLWENQRSEGLEENQRIVQENQRIYGKTEGFYL
jgi:hypothetical protein